jgi:halimadienyl-diphosphate synthase
MDLREKMFQVLRETGVSKMSRSAYDTAWVARLGDLDQSLSQQALNWLCENQLPDGSWGAVAPQNYHDRVICTLAAMVALTRRGRRSQDRRQIERGQHALEMLSKGATRGLMADAAGATIAFEMIMPTLLAEVEAHNIITHHDDTVLARLTRQRTAKIAKLPKNMINRHVTVAFSSEMVGIDGIQLLDVENLQERSGSIAQSPSATAFFSLYANPNSTALQAALDFLNTITVYGGASNIEPIVSFQDAWILWNVALTGILDDEMLALCQPSVQRLAHEWTNEGLGAVNGFPVKDGDTSAMAYDALTRFGVHPNLLGILHYEEDEYFRCYALEADPSLSANAHMLGALRQAGYEVQHPSVQKVLRFLKRTQVRHSFWFDKWHASPYYTTTHAIISAAGYADELITTAVDWILNTQNEDGSWGFYKPSAEETAYCLQALAILKRDGSEEVSQEITHHILKQGSDWLREHIDDPYPWFWIGKSLYCPELVVESAILSALMLVEQL